ncbi:MAG: glutamyl-tRNA reductase [SAR324 cluster bacterium]
MTLSLLSFSFKTAPIEVREPLAVSAESLPGELAVLRRRAGLAEAMLLSTCNRVEYYFTASDVSVAEKALLEALRERLPEPDRERLAATALRLSRRDALNHLFRVAASLESMVVGEPQILGQLKEAFQIATEHAAVGPLLTGLMPQVLRTAKRVRTETQIGRFPISIGYVAVQLAQRIFASLADQSVLVIGAGEMAELAVEQLKKAGIRRLIVTNRTLSNAVKLAERFEGAAQPFERLPELVAEADIVLSSTGARSFVVSRETVRQAMRARRGKSMFFIDIAVPRDVDPAVNELANVYRYDVDDLQSVADANRKEREHEAQAAQSIIDQEVERYVRWRASLGAVPTVRALRDHFTSAAEEELSKTLARLRHLAPQDRERVERLARTLVNRLLHTPSMRLKQTTSAEDGQLYAETLMRLFKLEPGGDTAAGGGALEGERRVLHLPLGTPKD